MFNIFKNTKKPKKSFYSTDVWTKIASKYNLKQKLWDYVKASYTPEDLKSGFILYGEIYGPGIQGEKYSYGLKDIEFAAFDIEKDGEYIWDAEFQSICDTMSIPKVPYLWKGYWKKETQDSFVTNQFIEGTKIPHEGIVVKSVFNERNKVSKVINNDYLIFAEKHLIPDSH